MDFHQILVFIQHGISLAGIVIIFIGVLIALAQYFYHLFVSKFIQENDYVNGIRLRLGRVLTLGLEFIVASDLIGTMTTPDYYSVGILVIIVIIRTVLSYTLNREIENLTKDNQSKLKPSV
ncbi:DUF1622 domain-containing protein [Candidatus Berkiella aquae]|uniref:DUF1622 domain-containing protein n=1 Tax=Candidatus Berkiella aquae TaxID=295108 RepID=A0A0Q9Z2R4_9GAMM|nr:DUF1622 domain-containing protein [Candidatus Berkiella aquae]MCS5711899.1 DUF1622 domain-containing protein [Candidatus Berkiella aquae]